MSDEKVSKELLEAKDKAFKENNKMLDKASKKVMIFQFLAVVIYVLCVAIIIVNLNC